VSDPYPRLTSALGRRYAFEHELGRGGMGTVFLARDLKHGRRVALKVLPPDLAGALGPERFLREIQIAARLSHPHILPLYDSGQAGGLLYYVMPYVEGESLRSRLLRENQVAVSDALEIARQIADALAFAHAAGVIHRDIKPENILLAGYPPRPTSAGAGWHALLGDFGVAKAVGAPGSAPEGDLRTDTGLPLGTLAYASPEQAAGSRALDGRSDLYSLGCVLYEMLVGDPSGGRPTASQILENRFAVQPPATRSLRAEVPEWVDRVLARALARDPAERFASAAEFRDALTAPTAIETASQAAAPAGALVPRRPQLVWMGTGAATLALIGAAVAFLPRHSPKTDPKQVVVAGFENKTGDSALAPVGDIAVDYIARGLAATRLLHEVYDARATALEAGQPARPGMAQGRELARRVGAGTVVGGSYYREGDSLHFETQLVDAASGKLVLSLEPVVGPSGEKTRIIETLRQRVMGGFATVFGSGFEDWKAASVPPSYDAYQEMLIAGDDLWVFKSELAAEHLHRAIARDSDYSGAKVQLSHALATMGLCDEVDSIARSLEPEAGQLPPAERGVLAYSQAQCDRDREGQVEAAKAVLAAAPHSVGYTVLGGINAIELGRPREGLAILLRFDAEHVPLSDQQRNIYWGFVGYAYHDLGEFRKQLQTAARIDHSPDARALAGLRDSAAVRRLVRGWLEHGDTTGPTFDRAECAALELRAHGSPAAAAALLEYIVARRGPARTAEAEAGPCLWNLFTAHYYAGRWEDARAAYARRISEDSSDVRAHAALAALAVRRKDWAELAEQKRWLARHDDLALAWLGLARVAALQGRRDEAVNLLTRALQRGLERHFVHIDPDLDSLRDYPPYQELMRPKG
jgi:tetratricopeptide (TPR) repeat protein